MGEFVLQSRASLVHDHDYSHGPHKCVIQGLILSFSTVGNFPSRVIGRKLIINWSREIWCELSLHS